MKPKLTIPAALSRSLKQGLRFFLQNHYFVVSVVLLASLAVVIYLVNLTLNAPTDNAYRDEQSKASSTVHFDQQTIDKINRLQPSSNQTPPPAPPSGARTNPFAE